MLRIVPLICCYLQFDCTLSKQYRQAHPATVSTLYLFYKCVQDLLSWSIARNTFSGRLVVFPAVATGLYNNDDFLCIQQGIRRVSNNKSIILFSCRKKRA